MSPDGMAFTDGTAQVWAARAGLRPAPTARVGVRHESEPKCFGLMGNRDEAGNTTGLRSRYIGWRPGLVCERSAPLASLPLTVTIATRTATIKTVHAKTGAKFPP